VSEQPPQPQPDEPTPDAPQPPAPEPGPQEAPEGDDKPGDFEGAFLPNRDNVQGEGEQQGDESEG
jgi:hypothetical protein